VLQGQDYGLAQTTYYFELPCEFDEVENFTEYVKAEFDININRTLP